jgi:hypothetical protein
MQAAPAPGGLAELSLANYQREGRQRNGNEQRGNQGLAERRIGETPQRHPRNLSEPSAEHRADHRRPLRRSPQWRGAISDERQYAAASGARGANR